VARKDFPANDLRTFATYVKAHADELNVAHSGVGSVFFTTKPSTNVNSRTTRGTDGSSVKAT
jgi:hypothetical protein